MKGLVAVTAMLAVVLGLVFLSAPSQAQESQSMTQTQDSAPTQDIKEFAGTVVKEGDSFVLRDEANNVTYRLDDQEKAKAHEGKQVKVNGTLDSTTNTIRVSDFMPVA